MTMTDVTEETLAAIAKAQTTGILESTGAYSYDLTGIVRLIPVVTPFRSKVARKQSTNGNPYAVWRAYLNINQSQPRATPGFDYAANEVLFSEQDFQAAYKPIGLAGLVTQDSFDVAKGLYDPYAEATMQVLNQTLIAEDKLLIGGQSYALAQPGTMTVVNSTTGGSLAASTTIQVAVAARTASGYFYGGNSRSRSSATTTTTGATSKLTCSVAAVKGAVAYDWFFSNDSGTTFYYYTTTTVASAVINTTIVANNTVPTNLPGLSTAVPTRNGAADNGSAQANEVDGLIATLTGDYNGAGQFVATGSGTANGAVWVDNGGAALTLTGGSVTEINNLLLSIWNQVYTSPTAIMMNALQAQEIANLVLAQPSAVTYLQTDEAGRVDTVAGGRVGHIVNTAAGGVTVPLEVHPNVPPGTIIARTDRVPFPQANISTTLEVRTLRDMSQFDYATARVASTAGGGPRKEFEIRSVEAFVNRAPVSMGVLTNVA